MFALENLYNLLWTNILIFELFRQKGPLFHVSVKFYMNEISAAFATNF